MDLSFRAQERIVSDELKRDALRAVKFHQSGRVLLEDARQLTDKDLLEKLAGYGVALSRESLHGLIVKHDSAESIALALFDRYSVVKVPNDSDWIWLSICVLWERWFTDKPSFEMLDDVMMEGYKYWEDRKLDQNEKKAADVWLVFWKHVRHLIVTRGLTSPDALESVFRGSDFISNWFNDFSDALFNTGVEEKNYLSILLKYSEDWMTLLSDDGQLALESCRRTIAECYTLLGNNDKAEKLYAEWIEADPNWGWGYIGWSDSYHFIDDTITDLARAEALLRRGLAIPTVCDRSEIYDRLIGLLFDQNRDSEAEALRAEALEYDRKHRRPSLFTKTVIIDEGCDREDDSSLPLILAQPKVGRNEPCPCGSRKKYKKCCIN